MYLLNITFNKMNLNIDIFYIIIDFLNPSDIKNLNKSKKLLFFDKKYKSYCKCMIISRSANILIKFWKKYLEKCKILNCNLFLTKKLIAFYFFRYYERRYWDLWYNNNIEWKKKIIDKYKKEEISNPSRLDLFHLVLQIPVGDMISIGW